MCAYPADLEAYVAALLEPESAPDEPSEAAPESDMDALVTEYVEDRAALPAEWRLPVPEVVPEPVDIADPRPLFTLRPAFADPGYHTMGDLLAHEPMTAQMQGCIFWQQGPNTFHLVPPGCAESFILGAISRGEVVHEVVRGGYPFRLALDIDAPTEKLKPTRYTEAGLLAEVLRAFRLATVQLGGHDRHDRVAVASSSDRTKASFHVVLPDLFVEDYREARAAVELMLVFIDADLKDFVDMHVGVSQFNLRALGVAKSGRVKCPTADSIARGLTRLEDYLVQPYGATTPRTLVNYRSFTRKSAAIALAQPSLSDETQSELVRLVTTLMPWFAFRDEDRGTAHFRRLGSHACDLCDGAVHNGDGGKAKIGDDGRPRFFCWRPSSWGRWLDLKTGKVCVSTKDKSWKGARAPSSLQAGQPPKDPDWLFKLLKKNLPGGIQVADFGHALVHSLKGRAEMPRYPTEQDVAECPGTPDLTVLAIKAPCGVGKTITMFKDVETYLAMYPKIVLVSIACRRQQTRDVSAKARKFGIEWRSYLEEKGPIGVTPGSGAIMVQYESLPRLEISRGTQIYLCLDEWGAILRQFESPYVARASQCQHVLAQLCRSAVRVVAMGQELDDDSVKVLDQYTGRRAYKIFYDSDLHANKHVVIVPSLADNAQHAMGLAEKGQRMTGSFSSKDFLLELKSRIEADAEAAGRTYRIRAYTADTPEKEKEADFSDVETAWGQYDAIFFTATVQEAVSYTGSRFPTHLGFYTNEPLPAEAAIQMMFRNRPATEWRIGIEHNQKAADQVPEALTTPEGVLQSLLDGQALFEDRMPEGIKALAYTDSNRRTLLQDHPRISAYCYTKARQNLSTKRFYQVFMDGLRRLHITIDVQNVAKDDASRRALGKLRADLDDRGEAIKGEKAKAIAEAKPYEDEEYGLMKENLRKDAEQTIRFDASRLRREYGVGGERTLSQEWVERWSDPGTRTAFKNLTSLKGAGPTAAEAVGALVAQAARHTGGAYHALDKDSKDPWVRPGQNTWAPEVLVRHDRGLVQRHDAAHRLLKCLGYSGIDDTKSLSSAELKEASQTHSEELTELRRGAALMFGSKIEDGDKDTDVDDSNAAIRLATSVLSAMYGLRLVGKQKKKKGCHGERHRVYSIGPTETFKKASADGVVLPQWAPGVPDTLAQIYG